MKFMAMQKHNWAEYKLEYMMSKTIEVNEFLREKLGGETAVNNGNFQKQTTGWRGEKDGFLRNVQNEALAEMKIKLKKEYAPSTKELGEMLRGIIDLTKIAIKKETDNCVQRNADGTITILFTPDLANVERAYKITKNELGESSDTTKVITISDDDAKLIEGVLNDNL